jgi:two-component system chemotaxis response regulator CheY
VHILIVDDSRTMRRILQRIVEDADHTTEQAANGLEALQLLQATVQEGRPLPDTLLVDWNMPVMDGLTLVREIRADPSLQGLTVLMCTTESEPRQIESALEAGADEYLIKPFTAESVLTKLDLAGLA